MIPAMKTESELRISELYEYLTKPALACVSIA